jgi:hypothetical protein
VKKCADTEIKATLMAMEQCTRGSLNAHVPIECIRSKVDESAKPVINDCLRRLKSKGYVVIHPTRNQTTYALTRCGSHAAKKLKEEADLAINWNERCEEDP